MSIALRRLSYAVQLNTPKHRRDCGVFHGTIPEERHAVLRHRTATLDRERNEAFAKWREGLGACNGGEKIKVSPAFFGGTFLIQMQSDSGANPDGWANEQPLKKQGAADANTDPHFSCGFVLRTQ